MEYKANATDVMARRDGIFERQGSDRILFTMPTQLCRLDQLRERGFDVAAPETGIVLHEPPSVDDLWVKWDETLKPLKERPDDSLPMGHLWRDYSNAMILAAIGLPIHYLTLTNGTASSARCDDPPDWRELMGREFDLESDMAQRMRACAEHFRTRCAGKFPLSPYIVNDGLHMLTLLQGYEKTYLDFCADRETALRYLAWATEVCIEFHEFQLDLMGQQFGGWTNRQVGIRPRKVVTLNLDDYLMCGEDFYRDFGLPFHTQISQHFGGCVIHYHTPDPRLLDLALSVPNVEAIQISHDPNLPRPIETIGELRERCGDVPIIDVFVPRDRFETMLKARELPGAVEYLVLGVRDLGDARQLADLAHEYRAARAVPRTRT